MQLHNKNTISLSKVADPVKTQMNIMDTIESSTNKRLAKFYFPF